MKCSGASHHYTVEVVGKPVRYAGTSEDEAVSALLTISPDCDEEGYVVAEHADAGVSVYCPAESNRIENAAIASAADMEARWADAVAAFHGDGEYAIGSS